jgi:hypothetical protein
MALSSEFVHHQTIFIFSLIQTFVVRKLNVCQAAHHKSHRQSEICSFLNSASDDAAFHVQTSTIPGAGRGLFALQAQPNGTQLLLITTDKPSSYILKGQYLEDGAHNLGNFANEPSGSGAQTNADFVSFPDGSLALELTRDVGAGEEIFADYGPLFERNYGQKVSLGVRVKTCRPSSRLKKEAPKPVFTKSSSAPKFVPKRGLPPASSAYGVFLSSVSALGSSSSTFASDLASTPASSSSPCLPMLDIPASKKAKVAPAAPYASTITEGFEEARHTRGVAKEAFKEAAGVLDETTEAFEEASVEAFHGASVALEEAKEAFEEASGVLQEATKAVEKAFNDQEEAIDTLDVSVVGPVTKPVLETVLGPVSTTILGSEGVRLFSSLLCVLVLIIIGIFPFHVHVHVDFYDGMYQVRGFRFKL